MDDYLSGRDLPKDPTIEYLQGYSHAESLYDQPNFQEQVDDRVQEDWLSTLSDFTEKEVKKLNKEE